MFFFYKKHLYTNVSNDYLQIHTLLRNKIHPPINNFFFNIDLKTCLATTQNSYLKMDHVFWILSHIQDR